MSLLCVPAYGIYEFRKVIKMYFVLACISAFLASCSPNENVTLLSKPDGPTASYLVWSPFGNEISATGITGNPPVSVIYLLDVKTKSVRLLIDQDFGRVSAEGWTPDGEKLMFTAFTFKDSKYGTWLVDPKGIEQPKLFLNDIVLAWLPTYEVVVYKKDTSTHEVSLYLRNLSTGEETEFFSAIGIGVGGFSSSSDGSILAFAFEKVPVQSDVYVFDSSTKKTVQITTEESITDPSLSPDGKFIAYTKTDSTGILPADYLHIMNSDGSCDVEVPGHLDIYSPAWSPDGKRLAYVGKNDGGIYLLDLVGAFGKDITREGLPCP